MMSPVMAMPAFMATQVDILSSDRVALRVIKDLKLLDNPQLRQQWMDTTKGQGSIEQWLVDTFQRQLDVKPSRESNVITINYRAQDPRFAAGMANAFAQAYIATTLELRSDPVQNFRKLFDGQAREARDALERAQAKVSAFQQAKGIIATDERFDVENARLNELSSQLTQMQAISADSSNRQVQAQGTQSDRLQEVLGNALVTGMKSDLARAEARLQELYSKYGDSHPQVIEAKANINELRTRLESEIGRVTGGVTVTNTINKGRETQIQRELAAQRTRVLQMKAVRDEGLVLQREVESAQRSYDAMMARLSQTALESQNTQSFANVLSVAQAPTTASSPKVTMNIGLSVALGLLLALMSALTFELVDRRVRQPEDLVALLGLPVIGMLPKPGAKKYKPGRPVMALSAQNLIALPSSDSGRSVR